jgi:hypothetical protein
MSDQANAQIAVVPPAIKPNTPFMDGCFYIRCPHCKREYMIRDADARKAMIERIKYLGGELYKSLDLLHNTQDKRKALLAQTRLLKSGDWERARQIFLEIKKATAVVSINLRTHISQCEREAKRIDERIDRLRRSLRIEGEKKHGKSQRRKIQD